MALAIRSAERGRADAGAPVTVGPSPRPEFRLHQRPQEILPGVYSLGESPPLFLYMLRAEGGALVLVDTGFEGQIGALRSAVRALGLDPSDIGHVVVTHLHLDHSMGIEVIRKESGAKIHMGAPDATILAGGAPWDMLLPRRVGVAPWITPGPSMPPVTVDHPIREDGDLGIPGLRLEALLTPGHTPGSTCFLLRTGGMTVLFSGDTISSMRAETGTYTAALHPRFGGDVDAYARSLEALGEIPVSLLLTGHPYLDPRESPPFPNPFLGPGAFRNRVGEALRELAIIRERLDRDGRDFLDDAPRWITPRVAHLGLLGRRSAYAYRSGEDVFLLDPGPPSEAAKQNSRLSTLGLRPDQVRARISTKGSAAQAVGGLTALPHPAGVTYLAKAAEGWVAFTGDTLVPTTADGIPTWRSAMLNQGSQAAWIAYLDQLASAKVSVWLPSRPYSAQNANLYDEEWLAVLSANRSALSGETQRR